MEEVQPQKITKLEGAERQLRAAIRLFFEEGDMLPVQTLVAAAHEVLFQLSGKKTGGSLLKNSGFIRPEMEKKWIDGINDVPNFLKHAGKDSTKSTEFFPDTMEYWIFDCILMHEQITARACESLPSSLAGSSVGIPMFSRRKPSELV